MSIASFAAKRGDKETLMLFRKKLSALEREAPDIAKEISKAISLTGGLGALRRFREIDAVPMDSDTGMELLLVDPDPQPEFTPIISLENKRILDRFIRERRHLLELKRAGIKPPSSLALMGPPGTGKTSLAQWIAAELHSPLFALNLASVVTSYLGQTGQNIKKVLDRARLESSVLLLDEFDALGRSRIENDDVGEMKRVVTVLLQELERWPDESVLIAATNLPELVDPAFRRRFSRWIRLSLPGDNERLKILQIHYKGMKISRHHLELAAICLVGASGADLAAFANRVATRQILDGVSPLKALWDELAIEMTERELTEDIVKRFIQTARKADSKRFTYRELAKLLRISHTKAMQIAKEDAEK